MVLTTKGYSYIRYTQPTLLLSGKRESGAKPAHEHKICATVTHLAAQGWRRPTRGWRGLAPTGAGVARGLRRPARGGAGLAPTGAGVVATMIEVSEFICVETDPGKYTLPLIYSTLLIVKVNLHFISFMKLLWP